MMPTTSGLLVDFGDVSPFLILDCYVIFVESSCQISNPPDNTSLARRRCAGLKQCSLFIGARLDIWNGNNIKSDMSRLIRSSLLQEVSEMLLLWHVLSTWSRIGPQDQEELFWNCFNVLPSRPQLQGIYTDVSLNTPAFLSAAIMIRAYRIIVQAQAHM